MELFMIFPRFGKWLVICIGLLPVMTNYNSQAFADETKAAAARKRSKTPL
jgi:hypothetical protein